MPTNPQRSEFLKLSAVALAGAGLDGSIASAANRANDKLVVGVIGCGGRGRHDAGLFKNTPNVEVWDAIHDREALSYTLPGETIASLAFVKPGVDQPGIGGWILCLFTQLQTQMSARR